MVSLTTFTQFFQMMDNSTMAANNFICPTRLIKSDVEWNKNEIKDLADDVLTVALFTKDTRNMVGQNVIDFHIPRWEIGYPRNLLSLIETEDFYTTETGMFCVSDLFPNSEIIHLVGVVHNPSETELFAFTLEAQAQEQCVGNVVADRIILERLIVSTGGDSLSIIEKKSPTLLPSSSEDNMRSASTEEIEQTVNSILLKELTIRSA